MKRLGAVMFAFLVAGACSKKQAPKPADSATSRPARPKLVRSEPLPELARSVLRDRMTEHGDDMESLLWSVLMLDHETAASIAERIGKAPKLSRATGDDPSTLNAALPTQFFDLQDALYDGAARLRTAALAGDDAAVAKQYARISSACIGCHSLYLRLPPVPEK